MNWIPEIMAASQGYLNSPAAQELGQKLRVVTINGMK